ncbi:MAG: YqhA family protein [Gemmatimonadota bacterium]|nr:YqhA family protein [Gemmatimonadota bacterium]
MTPPSSPSPRGPLLRLLGASRYLIILAVLSTLAAGTALLVYGTVETYSILQGLITATGSSKGAKGLILAVIELTDLFLLATVLYVIAIGLFELFIDDRLDLPNWLEIHDLNDLKEKLIGVIIVVLAVLFLGQVATWDGVRDLLGYGTATALVIAALTWFVSQKGKKERDKPGA